MFNAEKNDKNLSCLDPNKIQTQIALALTYKKNNIIVKSLNYVNLILSNDENLSHNDNILNWMCIKKVTFENLFFVRSMLTHLCKKITPADENDGRILRAVSYFLTYEEMSIIERTLRCYKHLNSYMVEVHFVKHPPIDKIEAIQAASFQKELAEIEELMPKINDKMAEAIIEQLKKP